jgi:hypothetical protein
MKRLAVLALVWTTNAFAQATSINGPTGTGTAKATAKVTGNNGLQVDVTRVQGADTTLAGTISAACTTGIGCGAGTNVAIALLGKSTAGVQVTAISSPVGITLQCDLSMNGGTTWSETAAGNCSFDNGRTYVKSLTVTSFAVGDVYQLFLSGGATNVRVRASALTSGTITVNVTATDAQDPAEVYSSPGGANSWPTAMAAIGAQDATTATTTNPIRSQAPASVATTVPSVIVLDSVARTASPAYTATHFGHPSMDVTGSQYMMVGQAGGNTAGVTAASAAPTYATAALTTTSRTEGVIGNATSPSLMAVTGGVFNTTQPTQTNGQSAAFQTTARGEQLVALSQGALPVTVAAVNSTNATNVLHVEAARSTTSPTAVTNGNGAQLQVDAATGALYVEIVPSTAAQGTSFGSFTVNTAANIKASAGALYGAGAVTTAGVCWLQFYNTAGSPTCGTSVVYALPVTTTGIFAPPGMQLFSFATGIGICCSSTPTGGTTCGGTCSGTIYYK